MAYERLETRQLLATLVGNNTVTYQDIDGDAVTVTFSRGFLTPENVTSIFTFNTGSVSGSNAMPQQLRSINLIGLAAANRTNITVSVVGAGGVANGVAHIGQIMAEGVDINDVVMGGDIVGGSASGWRDLSFVGSLYVGPARNVTVGGSLVSGTDETAGNFAYNGAIVAEDDFQHLTIRGNVHGNWTYPATIQAHGQQTPSGRTDFAFRSITIGGYVLFGRIYAGYALLGGRHNADAQIGTVTVGDAWLGSDLVVGVDELTGGTYRKFNGFGVKDRDDVDARVNSITIAGRTRSSGIPGIASGFVAEHVVSFSREGTPLPLKAGKSNDDHLLDTVFGGLR